MGQGRGGRGEIIHQESSFKANGENVRGKMKKNEPCEHHMKNYVR